MAKQNESVAADIAPCEGGADGARGGGPDAETRAVASHPEFQALVARARRERERGQGTPAEEFFRELGLPLDSPEPAEDKRVPGNNGAAR